MRGLPPDDLPRAFGWLSRKVADDARRNRNRKRFGRVVEVDAEKGLARIDLKADGASEPFRSAWLPWREQAMGSMRTHFPLSVGQEVVVRSENGDLTDAEIDTSLPTEDTSRPSQSGSEYVLADVGDTRIVVRGGEVVIATGTLKVEAATLIEGDQLTHNGTDVGESHRHTDVEPGGALTGLPVGGSPGGGSGDGSSGGGGATWSSKSW